jgi:NAD(P)-dependent dehydrogenase (short-subunit alcohol dehydrogenase family)
MELKDKVVIVTGASRGIGRETAIEFGRRGASVVLAARTLEARRTLPGTLSETVELIEAAGGRAVAVRCDVADPADVERLIQTAVDTYGGIDVVVNNAADMIGGDFEQLLDMMLGKPAAESTSSAGPQGPLDAWLRQFAVNVHGPYLLSTLATPHLKARGGGAIVNITSEAADLIPLEEALRTPSINPSIGYGVTKAALNRLTNALAARLAGDNIAVVAIDPGVVRTEVAQLLGEADILAPAGASVSIPAQVIVNAAAGDLMTLSGQVLRAQD